MDNKISLVLPPRIPSDPQSWQSQGRVEREAEKKVVIKRKLLLLQKENI